MDVDCGHWRAGMIWQAKYVEDRTRPGRPTPPAITRACSSPAVSPLTSGSSPYGPPRPSRAPRAIQRASAREWATRRRLPEVAARRAGVRVDRRRTLHGRPNGNRSSPRVASPESRRRVEATGPRPARAPRSPRPCARIADALRSHTREGHCRKNQRRPSVGGKSLLPTASFRHRSLFDAGGRRRGRPPASPFSRWPTALATRW